MDGYRIAAAYVRVSTGDQTELSPDSQLSVIREYAAKNGWVIPEEHIYIDEGISGRTAAKRPAFHRMIAAAKEAGHPFDCILVWKFSRFARNQEESVVYKAMLRKDKAEVFSVSEPLIEGPFGELRDADAQGRAVRGVGGRRGRGAAPYGTRAGRAGT